MRQSLVTSSGPPRTPFGRLADVKTTYLDFGSALGEFLPH